MSFNHYHGNHHHSHYLNTIPMQAGYVNDANGNPQVVFTPMTIEQQINYRNRMWSMQREYMEKTLKENFPTKYMLFHAISLILIGIVEIALQIVLIVNKGAIYYVGNGIWGGIALIFLAAFVLLLIKTRKYSIFIATFVLHPFGLMVAFGAFVIVNAIGLSGYGSCIFGDCFNSDMKPINIAMLILGIIAVILIIAYFSSICIFFGGSSRYKQNLNQTERNIHPTSFQNNQFVPPYTYNPSPAYNSAPTNAF